MKVVYNSCYGRFGLSVEGMRRYAEIKGVEPDDCDYGIPRDDPALAQVVEELGTAANASSARLAIEDVPVGTKWKIDKDDGFESVMTVDDYDWHTAR
ncbi:MAG: hypothetical protein GEV06_16700 [Luteitalea sp.]|nr:hypothetical protein [Luteitalea sp.]